MKKLTFVLLCIISTCSMGICRVLQRNPFYFPALAGREYDENKLPLQRICFVEIREVFPVAHWKEKLIDELLKRTSRLDCNTFGNTTEQVEEIRRLNAPNNLDVLLALWYLREKTDRKFDLSASLIKENIQEFKECYQSIFNAILNPQTENEIEYRKYIDQLLKKDSQQSPKSAGSQDIAAVVTHESSDDESGTPSEVPDSPVLHFVEADDDFLKDELERAIEAISKDVPGSKNIGKAESQVPEAPSDGNTIIRRGLKNPGDISIWDTLSRPYFVSPATRTDDGFSKDELERAKEASLKGVIPDEEFEFFPPINTVILWLEEELESLNPRVEELSKRYPTEDDKYNIPALDTLFNKMHLKAIKTPGSGNCAFDSAVLAWLQKKGIYKPERHDVLCAWLESKHRKSHRVIHDFRLMISRIRSVDPKLINTLITPDEYVTDDVFPYIAEALRKKIIVFGIYGGKSMARLYTYDGISHIPLDPEVLIKRYPDALLIAHVNDDHFVAVVPSHVGIASSQTKTKVNVPIWTPSYKLEK